MAVLLDLPNEILREICNKVKRHHRFKLALVNRRLAGASQEAFCDLSLRSTVDNCEAIWHLLQTRDQNEENNDTYVRPWARTRTLTVHWSGNDMDQASLDNASTVLGRILGHGQFADVNKLVLAGSLPLMTLAQLNKIFCTTFNSLVSFTGPHCTPETFLATPPALTSIRVPMNGHMIDTLLQSAGPDFLYCASSIHPNALSLLDHHKPRHLARHGFLEIVENDSYNQHTFVEMRDAFFRRLTQTNAPRVLGIPLDYMAMPQGGSDIDGIHVLFVTQWWTWFAKPELFRNNAGVSVVSMAVSTVILDIQTSYRRSERAFSHGRSNIGPE